MDKKIDLKIDEFLKVVKQEGYPVDSVYLFGSYAKGNASRDSDIDLALIFSDLDDMDKFNIQVELMLIASEFDIRIEPHPLSTDEFYSESPFAAEIRRTGYELKNQILSEK